jgi:hypothetical protein
MSEQERKILRREFLKKGGRIAAGAALAAGAVCSVVPERAFGKSADDTDTYDFLMPRVKFTCTMNVNDNWNAFPGGDRNLLEEFKAVVRCKVKLPPDCQDSQPHSGRDDQFNAVVDLTDIEEMRKYPFLFMTASGSYKLSSAKKKNIRQYIYEGGFLLMDDCVHGKVDDGDFFYQSCYKILNEIFGAGSVRRIPNEHEIFHNVHNLGDIGLPHIIGQYHGARGVFIGDRLAVFLSSTDIHCGWADSKGNWFGRGGKMGIGKHGHKEAIQIGVNIIMYALTH